MEDSKQTRIRVAIKWATGEQVTLEEFNLWVKMMQAAPVIGIPSQDEAQAAIGKALAVMQGYLQQQGK